MSYSKSTFSYKTYEKNWSKYPASIFGPYVEELKWNPIWAMYLDEFGNLPENDDYWDMDEENFEDLLCEE